MNCAMMKVRCKVPLSRATGAHVHIPESVQYTIIIFFFTKLCICSYHCCVVAGHRHLGVLLVQVPLRCAYGGCIQVIL
jgi:hypothetical protein